MKYFEVNRNITIKCDQKRTRNGFKHTATLQNAKCEDLEYAECHYLNRTWERYEYQTVLKKLLRNSTELSKHQKGVVKKFIENGARVEDDLKPLKTIGAIAALGDVFGQTRKQKNDFKTRILKAGLEGRGLIIPDDWNELTEREKEKRLNKVTKHLTD